MIPLLWIGLLVLVAPGDNLLVNGDFAAGAASWEPGPGLAGQGRFAVEAGVATLANEAAGATLYVAQRLAVTAGQWLLVSGESRSGPLRETAGVMLVARGAGDQVLNETWVHYLPRWGTPRMTAFEGRYRVPEAAVAVEVRLAIYRPGEAQFRALSVALAEPPRRPTAPGERLADFGLAAERIPVPVPVAAVAVRDAATIGTLDLNGRLRVLRERQEVWAADLGGFPLSLAWAAGGPDPGAGQWVACVAAAPGEPPLRVFEADGRPRWAWSGEGRLPSRATTGDLDGDGVDEVLVACANQLIALSATGQELWRRSFGGPRQRIARVGSDSGDGQWQVFAVMQGGRNLAAAFTGGGAPHWRYLSPSGTSWVADAVAVADLDGDGRDEMVVGAQSGQVICLDRGELKWWATRAPAKLRPTSPLVTGQLGPADPRLAVADFAPDRPGLETLVAILDQVFLLDADGRLIWDSPSGLLLQDLVPSPDDTLYAPSGGFRDPAIYRLRPVYGQGNPLASATYPQPVLARLDELAAEAAAASPDPAPAARIPGDPQPARRSVLFADWGSMAAPDLPARLRAVDQTFRQLENDGLEYVALLWPKDLPVELHRGPLIPPETILATARLLEELGRPFMFFSCHGAAPNLSLDLVRQTLDAAPTACRGFYVAENMEVYGRPQWGDFRAWLRPVLELCRARGKQVIFKEMYEAWSSIAPLPDVQETILRPEYRETVVPMYATNSPHAPDLQLAGMLGLAHAGRVASWGISTQHWNWSWSEQTLMQHWPNLCPPDVILRMELVAAGLGARWFHVEGGQEYLDRGTAEVLPHALRHREMVYQVLRKGLLPDVPPADHLEFSPLVIVRSPWPDFGTRVAGGESLGSALGRAVALRTGLLGVGETLQTVHPGYLPAALGSSTRYMTSMFPAMPHGWYRSVPAEGTDPAFLAGQTLLRTDGVHWLGPPPDLPALLAASDAQLGVQCDDAVVIGLRLPDRVRVLVIDSDYLLPTDRTVTVRLGFPAAAATNRLTGEAVPLTAGRLTVALPAGGWQLIDVTPAG